MDTKGIIEWAERHLAKLPAAERYDAQLQIAQHFASRAEETEPAAQAALDDAVADVVEEAIGGNDFSKSLSGGTRSGEQ